MLVSAAQWSLCLQLTNRLTIRSEWRPPWRTRTWGRSWSSVSSSLMTDGGGVCVCVSEGRGLCQLWDGLRVLWDFLESLQWGAWRLRGAEPQTFRSSPAGRPWRLRAVCSSLPVVTVFRSPSFCKRSHPVKNSDSSRSRKYEYLQVIILIKDVIQKKLVLKASWLRLSRVWLSEHLQKHCCCYLRNKSGVHSSTISLDLDYWFLSHLTLSAPHVIDDRFGWESP